MNNSEFSIEIKMNFDEAMAVVGQGDENVA